MSRTMILVLLVSGLAVPAAAEELPGGEIHGTIETVDGKSFTGPVRWGGDEAFWDDTLDAHKTEVIEDEDGEEKGFELSFFGWKVVDSGAHGRTIRSFAVPFGHLASIEPLPDGSALVVLKSGEEFELDSHGSSDIGPRMDEIAITTEPGKVTELRWTRIKRVRFSNGAGGGLEARRLHGTVELEDETKLSGFIVWDADERMTDEILDGEEGRTEHDVPFSAIESIERLPRGSKVLMRDGKELVLTGTNDVDRGHRGVAVIVPGVGTGEIDWDDVHKVTFDDAPGSRKYADFDGGRRLSGAVKTTLGPSFTGEIVWDRDEKFTWEALDGESDHVDWAIPFENIVAIKPIDDIGVELRLVGDRVLELYGSNDVDASNRGIVITSHNGATSTETSIEWESLASVEFK